MAREAYERLSAQDASFLVFEGEDTPMHVGGPTIYEIGPLATAHGGVDIARIRAYIESRLSWVPRYRQRLAWIPLEGHPVWVDDDRFNLNYHVRHTSLPRPGSDAQLKQLAARLLSLPLDRRRPLWEAWIVEGLQGNRFATIIKVHHCMVDGVSGVALAALLMRPDPDERIEEPAPWHPRPAPRPDELLFDALRQRLAGPLVAARALRTAVTRPAETLAAIGRHAAAAWDMLSTGLPAAPPTPINQPIGPHRRFDWLVIPLAEVKAIKNRLGGTVNDVALATVTGAVRRFLEHRRVSPQSLDFRAAVPVNMRAADDRQMGNRVSAWLTALPIQERDPRRRLAKVRALTTDLKASRQALAAEMFTDFVNWTGSSLLLRLGVRFTARLRPYNLLVTNVRGPQQPLYLLGARMLEAYPMVPLFEGQGLGVALFSYCDRLCWGFNADWDVLPDLTTFVAAVRASFDELKEAAAGVAVPLDLSRRPRRARAARGGRALAGAPG
jgi:WS/DGAT/MGAT family acyltransferase